MTDFSTADLCDKYDNDIQVLTPMYYSYGGVSKFSGKISTCKIIDNNTELLKLLQTEGFGRICVVDVEAKYIAVVGDKLMDFAKQNNWAGILVNGYIRDTQTIKSINVGLIALGTCPKKVAQVNSGECGVDLNFSNVNFIENHYLYADTDGVIVAPHTLEM